MDLAYARQILHRCGAVGRCTAGESEPVAPRPWQLPAITRRAPPVENASAQCLETTYVPAGESEMVHASAFGRPSPDGNVPTGDNVKSSLVTGRMRRRRHIGTSGPHVGCGGEQPQYTAIFRRGGGPVGSRARAPAATSCSASTYVRAARVGRGGPSLRSA